MSKTMKCRFLLPGAVLIFFALQSGFAAEQSERRLVSPELLERVGLKILWENVLPTETGENLERLLILGDQIYAISDKHYMLCLNKDNGRRVFGKTVELGGLRVEQLGLHDDKLISVAGNRLFEIDPKTGIEHITIDVDYSIVCLPAWNDSFIYLSGDDRRLHALRAEDKVEVFNVAAENNSMITTIVAEPHSVIFGTDKGNIISILPNLPVRLWQFDAPGAIIGSIIRDGMSLYFADGNMNIYRLDIIGTPEGARIAWEYLADGFLNTAPCVTKMNVYQVVHDKELTALNKEDGTFLWSVPSGTGFLAEAKGRSYVITKDGTLVVMNNNTKKRLYSVNFAGVSIHAANTVDSKIYIADKSGRIACLGPLE